MRQSLGIFAAMILMACGLYAVISPAFAQTCCPDGCAQEGNRCVTTGPLWTRCIPITCAEGSRRPSAGSLALRASTEPRCSPGRYAQRVLTWPQVRFRRSAH